MVTDVGDDARWNVSAADVGTVLGIAHRAGFDRVWIAGGWGVDALVGHQTRIHSYNEMPSQSLFRCYDERDLILLG
jgi:alkanesulfonate monooxygenase SsuD/methylene tetrahydromethanopterin reductase-like flavin-dependent oxidoreductase (luciferase family)